MILDVVTKGTTDYSCMVRVVDSSDGTPETTVAYNTAGVDLWYRRPGGAHTSITEATQTEGGAHSDGGFVHVSDGYCRLDLPDAAVASGADYVDVGGTFTGMIVIGGRIRLTDVDLDDATRGGMTALPNASADAAGGLPISDAGGLDLDAVLSGNTPQTGDSYARLGAPAGASIAADIGTVDTVVDGIQTDLSNGTDGLGALKAIMDTSGVVVSDKTGFRLSATGVDDIFDEALSGHTSAGSFGAAMYLARSNTAQAGASTTITLDASASSTDDFYNNNWIWIVSGTGAGQGNTISDYNGTTKVATVQDTWATNPSSDSVFVIMPRGGLPGASAPTAAAVADAVWDEAMSDHVSEGSFGTMLQSAHEGTAQAGTSSSITLDATGSSSTDDFYNYNLVSIHSGTGAGQVRQVTDYNGTTKVATVDPAWTTTPSTDSEYVIKDLGIDAATTASIADAVWDEARAGHVTAGSFGEYVLADSTRLSGSTSAADGLEAAVSGATPLPANITQISDDATAATNMESFFDGTGYAGTGNTIPTVTSVGTVTGNVDGSVGSVTGSVGSVTGAVGSVTGNVGGNVTGSVGSLAAQAQADVNAEVLDVLNTDTFAEPGAVPAATASLAAKIGWLFALSRNEINQTATTQTLRNDADSGNIATSAQSDDGTTYIRGEWT